MTAMVRDLKTREEHRGRAPESIARRIWGRAARLREEHGTPGICMVVKPDTRQHGAYHVLARVQVVEDA